MRQTALVRVDVKKEIAASEVSDVECQPLSATDRCTQSPVSCCSLTYPMLSSYDVRCVRWVEALQTNNLRFLTLLTIGALLTFKKKQRLQWGVEKYERCSESNASVFVSNATKNHPSFFFKYFLQRKGPRYLSRYSDSLRAGRSADRIPVGARFSAPVQTGPGAHPASCTMGTESFPGVKRPGRGADHPPTSKRRGHERVGLYLSSPSGPSWPVIGRTLLQRKYVQNARGQVTKLFP